MYSCLWVLLLHWSPLRNRSILTYLYTVSENFHKLKPGLNSLWDDSQVLICISSCVRHFGYIYYRYLYVFIQRWLWRLLSLLYGNWTFLSLKFGNTAKTRWFGPLFAVEVGEKRKWASALCMWIYSPWIGWTLRAQAWQEGGWLGKNRLYVNTYIASKSTNGKLISS